MTFTLPWDVLAQVNHRLVSRNRGKGLTLSSDYRKKKQAAEMILVAQANRWGNGRPLIPEGRVRLEIRFFEPDRRRRDPSNLLKLIEDALSGAAYTDDSQIAELEWRRDLDRENPRAELQVWPI